MKIKMVSTYPPMKCGIGEHAKNLVESLERSGIKPEIIRIKDRYSANPFQFIKLARDAAKDTSEKDIIHVQFQLTIFGKLFGFVPGFYIILFLVYLKFLTRAKIILALHDSPSKEYSMNGGKKEKILFYYFKFIYIFLRLYTDHFIVHSENGKKISVREWEIDERKISVLPVGLQAKIKKMDVGKCKEKLGYKNKKILLILGYIRGSKNYRIVLEAMKRLDKNIVLLIAGGVQLEKDKIVVTRIVNTAEELKIQNRVKLLGFVKDDELPILINAADIGIDLRSQGGGDFLSSTMAMELSYTLPVLATNIPSFEKLKQEERCLETFDENNLNDLIKKIKELLYNRSKINLLKRNSRNYWKRNNWDVIGKKTKDLYFSLIKK